MWRHFRKLVARLKRTDRQNKHDAFMGKLPLLISLCEQLARPDTNLDPKTIAWFNARLKVLKMEGRFQKVALWIGAPQARFLLKYAGMNNAGMNNADLAPLMRQWLDSETGTYDFGGLKLPLPVNEVDDGLWPHFFESVVIYHLLDRFDPMLIFQFFPDSEGPYEWNGQFRLRENDVVFDCGANIGVFSARAAAKGARVYAFEPSRHIRETYLEKTAALNGGFMICPYALSDSPGNLEFIVYQENLSGSRIKPPEEKKDTRSKIEMVEAVRLDDFVKKQGIERIDFIKADIEGAERKMLAGAVQIMKKFSPKLSICTYHLPDDPEVLSSIILSAQPRYKIIQGPRKLYAYVE